MIEGGDTMKVLILNKEQFIQILTHFKIGENVDKDKIYDIYRTASLTLEQVSKSNILTNFSAVNPIDIILYSLGEYHYVETGHTKEQFIQLLKDENFVSSIAINVADKYISLSAFKVDTTKFSSKYLPPMSSLKVYVNFMIKILSSYHKNEPKSTLITDLLLKSANLCNCIIELLSNGYETEAFSTWRTLHECECTLTLLNKYGDPLIEKYLLHMHYGIAFKGGLKTKEETDETFIRLKDDMKKHNLKSKDMKKMIEYGWIYYIDEVKNNEDKYRLNFRDGVEKLAGLSTYASRYELSSEIIHSTPLLIYSNEQHFYYLTLLSLYESFFRLEQIFVSLFAKHVNEAQLKSYQDFRKVYFRQLVSIYQRELNNFSKTQKRNKKEA